MKYSSICVVFIWFLTSCGVSKLEFDQIKQLQPVTLYAKSTDFMNKSPMPVNAGILIRDSSFQHITIKDVYDMETGMKVKKGKTAWAMTFKDSNYFNLYYFSEVIRGKTFVKFDIEGKYCLILLGEDRPKELKPSSDQVGLANILSSEIGKMSNNWVDKNRMAYKVIFIDTDFIDPRFYDKCALGFYMSKGKLKDVIKKHNLTAIDSKYENVTNRLEKAIEIIKVANAINK